MKPHYIICMVLLMLLVVPASASNITITAEPLGGTLNIGPGAVTSFTADVSGLQRNAIQRITVDVPTGSQIDYTLYYGNGSTLSGQMIYNPSPGSCGSLVGINAPCQYSAVSIGSSRSEHFYTGLQEQGRIDIVGYGRNEDTKERLFIIYDEGSLLWHLPGDAMAYTPVASGVIYKFTLSSNKPITAINYYTNTRENVQKASETSLLDVLSEFAALLNQIKDSVIEVFWFFFHLAEFLWDNLWLIIALYIVLTGVVALQAVKSNIFRALKIWFQYQRSLMNFILGLWDTVVGLITKILK